MAKVLIPLAQGCEELEAVTLIDLFRRAGIEVISAGLDAEPVKASRGVVLVPDTTLDQVHDQAFDLIVLPGGLPGTERLNKDPRIKALVQRMAAAGKYVAAICAAPSVLGNAGLLQGRKATSYPGVLEKMALSGVTILDNTPVVTDGRIVTSRGPGTALLFALDLIEKLVGEAKRLEVAKGLLSDPHTGHPA
ncbi:MAG: DJ-1/PfpI family protein [Magnetococcales bacterium]|nr:DJ-1/PfpI family protein [Magnetococcales bacterium]